MRLLLDTQIFLWYLDQTARIPLVGREAIDAADNTILVSAVVIWEIAIKTSDESLTLVTVDQAIRAYDVPVL